MVPDASEQKLHEVWRMEEVHQNLRDRTNCLPDGGYSLEADAYWLECTTKSQVRL